ncbi:His-Xaa-Ser system radical SAM maturase HxsB [Microvirga massiliensis]|uniref:His-Xaa-Ser system radical SAM maturase HxsB n=1 Tax=Microvirga massiliensis TaxID=1033741 RepID=UPI00062BC12A|nr:His-Xaa-Ser system radical SAM maturase HxsB [Microvirga massiliensis]
MRPAFQPAAAFAPVDYAALPYRFARLSADWVLVTSEAGDHEFLNSTEFAALARGAPLTGETLRNLESSHIVYAGDPSTAVRLLAAKLRSRKSFLRGGPSLHIFVVTLGCDHSCPYCQVSRRSHASDAFVMSSAVADHAVDRLFESPPRVLTVEFQGGEPLLAFPVIRRVVEKIEARNRTEGRRITYAIATTLHHLTDDVLAFLKAHDFQVSTSLDGPASLHNANRPLPGQDAHALTLGGIERVREAIGSDQISALTTLTRRSLSVPEAIVDEYVRLGFRSVFLRPLSPFGFARRSERRLGYGTDEFLAFYERALDYIIALNARGIDIEETYASILLSSILTPFPTTYMDLRSPVGSGFGTLVYNYDGSVYASDEGRMLREMGEDSLRLGSVEQPYDELMRSPTMQLLAAAGLSEAQPGCSDCVFVPYCGPDPAGSLSRHGDPVGHRAESEHCKRHMGLFRILFERLAHDQTATEVFRRWVDGPAPAER